MYPPTLDALDADFITHRLWEAKDRTAFLAGLRDRVTAITTMGETGADAALMDALPRAKIIASNSVGVDAIDLAAAKARGVAVTNTPGVLTDGVIAGAALDVFADEPRTPEGLFKMDNVVLQPHQASATH